MNEYRKLLDLLEDKSSFNVIFASDNEQVNDFLANKGGEEDDEYYNYEFGQRFNGMAGADILKTISEIGKKFSGESLGIKIFDDNTSSSLGNEYSIQIPEYQQNLKQLFAKIGNEGAVNWVPSVAYENLVDFLDNSYGPIIDGVDGKINDVDVSTSAYEDEYTFSSSDTEALSAVIKSFIQLHNRPITLKILNQIIPKTKDLGSMASVVAKVIVNGGGYDDLESDVHHARSVREQQINKDRQDFRKKWQDTIAAGKKMGWDKPDYIPKDAVEAANLNDYLGGDYSKSVKTADRPWFPAFRKAADAIGYNITLAKPEQQVTANRAYQAEIAKLKSALPQSAQQEPEISEMLERIKHLAFKK